jgi:hypothetical protein
MGWSGNEQHGFSQSQALFDMTSQLFYEKGIMIVELYLMMVFGDDVGARGIHETPPNK